MKGSARARGSARGSRCNSFLASLSRFRMKNWLSLYISRASWTALTRARTPRSAVRLGAIGVIVSAVLLMSMASGRPVHTISRFICMGCERRGEFQHLYGTRRAAATHVGMSPDCLKLGLGVWEICIAACTGADLMAGGAGAAGPAPDVRHQPPGYPELYLYMSVNNNIT